MFCLRAHYTNESVSVTGGGNLILNFMLPAPGASTTNDVKDALMNENHDDFDFFSILIV